VHPLNVGLTRGTVRPLAGVVPVAVNLVQLTVTSNPLIVPANDTFELVPVILVLAGLRWGVAANADGARTPTAASPQIDETAASRPSVA
jgi:hypothetical protein